MDEQQVKQKMQHSLEALREDLTSVRTGRATSALVENIVVKAYGGAQSLKVMELSSITVPDPQSIVIEPWDKSIIGDIRKGIEAANVGLNPSIDGERIRLVIPPMTTEDREKYVKLLKQKLENARIMVRQIRGDAKKEIDDSEDLSEDQKFAQEKRLQEITDDFIKQIEEMGKKKEEELRTI